MCIRKYIVVALLALVCLASVTAQDGTLADIDTQNATMPDADTTCDIPKKDVYLPWAVVRKNKAKCQVGEYLNCVPCEMHTFKKKIHLARQCADCPEGQGTLGENSTKCKKFCKEGFYYNTTISKCAKCPVNTFMSVKCLKTECKSCPDGEITKKEGATSLDQCLLVCEPGFQSNPEKSTCVPCPPGTYKAAKGTEECQTCPTLKAATLENGATSKDECVKLCIPGKEFNKTSGLCVACERNFYKATNSSLDKCLPCELNTVTKSKGQASCEVECGAGYESDTAGGCTICPWGTYKVRSGNDDRCTPCPTNPDKTTLTRGAIKKGECVKLDACVTPALERLTDYYERLANMPFIGNENIVSVWKETCFTDLSILINAIITDYKSCDDLMRIMLPDVTIGIRTYGHAEQWQLFVDAAEHGGFYCEYLNCTEAHLAELTKCKGIMEDDPDQPLNFCSEEWNPGAKCVMLNVKNCPPLRFHPSVTEDINLPDHLLPYDIYYKQNLNEACGKI